MLRLIGIICFWAVKVEEMGWVSGDLGWERFRWCCLGLSFGRRRRRCERGDCDELLKSGQGKCA